MNSVGQADGTTPLTAIVLTQDEEVNIAACLTALDWCADVVLVDSGSRDRTLACAQAARSGVRTFTHPFRDFGEQRNWALENTGIRTEWVVFWDADERCPPACASAITAAVAAAGGCVGFYLAGRNVFLGRWLRRATLYPSWQLRLLRRGRVRYQREGHGQREVADGPLGYVRAPYDHYPFSKGIREWIERHNRYTTAELVLIERLAGEPLRLRELGARDAVVRRRCWKRLAARHPAARLLIPFYLYVLRGGFLDGTAGLLFCLLRLANQIHLLAKVIEAHRAVRAGGPGAGKA